MAFDADHEELGTEGPGRGSLALRGETIRLVGFPARPFMNGGRRCLLFDDFYLPHPRSV